MANNKKKRQTSKSVNKKSIVDDEERDSFQRSSLVKKRQIETRLNDLQTGKQFTDFTQTNLHNNDEL